MRNIVYFSLLFFTLYGQSVGSIKKLLKSRNINDNNLSKVVNNLDKIDNNESYNPLDVKEDVKILSDQDKVINVTKKDSSIILVNDDALEKVREENSKEIIQTIEQEERKNLYFGYDVFKSDPGLFQKSAVGSVDPNYLIGPGDEIILMLWGQIEQNQSYIVTKDGYLFIPDVGQVFVNGLNMAQLEKKLLRVLKKVHSSLGSDSTPATTFFDISLGSSSLRPLRIFALGEVDQPGAYGVNPNSLVFTSLYYFGGPSLSGTLRKVKLIRNKKEKSIIDLYDYLLSGSQRRDISLQRGDIIFFEPRGKTCTN